MFNGWKITNNSSTDGLNQEQTDSNLSDDALNFNSKKNYLIQYPKDFPIDCHNNRRGGINYGERRFDDRDVIAQWEETRNNRKFKSSS